MIVCILIISNFSPSFGTTNVTLPKSSTSKYVTIDKGAQFVEKKSTKEIKLTKNATRTFSEEVSSKTLKSKYSVITGPGNHPYSISNQGYLKQSLNKRKKVVTDYYTKGSKVKKRVTKILATPYTYTWKGYFKEADINNLAPMAQTNVKSLFEKKGWNAYLDTDLNINGNGPESAKVFGYTRTAYQDIRIRDPQSIYHELGHFLDYQYSLKTDAWASSNSTYNEFYKNEYLKIPSEYGVGGSITAVETFACFYDYYCRDIENMKENCPQAYKYIKRIVNSF